MLTVSDFQIIIKSCSIESRNDPSPKCEVVYGRKFSLKIPYPTHIFTSMLIFVQKCQKRQMCVIYENLDFVKYKSSNQGDVRDACPQTV